MFIKQRRRHINPRNLISRVKMWNNFGDLITPYFLKKFCDKKDYRFNFDNSNKPKVLSCGSIMRLCNENTIVYGYFNFIFNIKTTTKELILFFFVLNK